LQLFGSNAAWLLLAFLSVQTYTYYTRSVNDHPAFKTLVYSTVFIAVAESIAEAFVAYSFLVSGWGNTHLLSDFPKAIEVLSDLKPLFDALREPNSAISNSAMNDSSWKAALFVQFFFTWRIWTFCKATCGRKVKMFVAAVCIFIILTSICAFISAVLLTALVIIDPLADIPSGSIVLAWTVSTAIADVVITMCMMVILHHAKSSGCFGETRDRLSRLLRLTIQTGFLTSILAIPIAPLYIRVQVGIYTLTCFLLGKSYAISLLANLNARSDRSTVVIGKSDNSLAVPHLSTMVAFALRSDNSSSSTLLGEMPEPRVEA